MFDPIHDATPRHMQLGEGLLLANVDLDAILAADDPAQAAAALASQDAHLLGATQAGSQFRAAPELLHTEERGLRTPAAGQVLSGRWTATLSGTLLEISPRNAARLLNLLMYSQSGRRSTIAPIGHRQPAPLNSLCWIGDLGGGLMAIELVCPISTGGVHFTAGYHGTGAMPFTFMAQQRSPADTSLPFRMLWLREG